MAYSPDTWYAASGRSYLSLASRMMSRYGPAGFTIIMSAPSAMSNSISRMASLRLAAGIWYPALSPLPGAEQATSLKGP